LDRRIEYLLSGALGGLVTGIILAYVFFFQLNPAQGELQGGAGVVVINASGGQEAMVTAVVEDTRDSVVHISSSMEISAVPGHPPAVVGTGTGMIISREGYILTNYHVIEDASKVQVTFYSGTTQKATFVGSDPLRDVAVLKVETDFPLKPVVIGDSDNLKPGQFTIAIGNPYGLDNTVTTGIISATNRRLRTKLGFSIGGVIQTDTVINPGNSGGPLLNSRGEVIGMTSAIFSTDEGFQGIGFAIPIKEAMAAAEELISKGRIIGPSLGAVCSDIKEEFKESLDLKYEGVLLLCVQPGSPLDRAGLRGTRSVPGTPNFILGDIITQVGGEDVRSLDDIGAVIQRYKKGDEVEIRFIREGQIFVTRIVLP